VIRLALSHMVTTEQHRTAFALDSVVIELSFVLGPAMGVLVATAVSTQAALLGLAGLTAISAVGLMILNPPVAAAGDEPHSSDRSRIPISAPLVAVLAASVAATVVLAGTDVALIADLTGTGDLNWTGVVAGAWAVASIIGGLSYGALHRSRPPFLILLLLGLLTIPVGLASGPLGLSLIILPAGFLCAPLLSATTEVLTELVPQQARGEAMGWHSSALLLGTAIGAPLAGVAIDGIAPWAGFVAVGGVGVLLALAGLLAVRTKNPVAEQFVS
jgi:predicted MFS family arabinose efflux permease